MSRCESCGMPLNDSTHGPRPTAPSAAYCATCYADGAFTAPDASVEVREAAIAALVEQGVPPLTATRLQAPSRRCRAGPTAARQRRSDRLRHGG